MLTLASLPAMRQPTRDIHASRFTISVIVPVVDEAAWLARVLPSIRSDEAEVIVVDGESSDNSAAVAAQTGARVIHSPIRQRAAQMNAGAAVASAPILLFLHADTVLPSEWFQTLRSQLGSDPSIVGGAFRRRFDSPSRLLRVTCWLADWRGRLWGSFLGDQAMFVRASTFHALGGFGPYDRCEDLDLSRRMAALGRTCLLPDTVVSSARRFERRGAFIQTLFDFVTASRFLLATRAHAAEHRHSNSHTGAPVMPANEI